MLFAYLGLCIIELSAPPGTYGALQDPFEPVGNPTSHSEVPLTSAGYTYEIWSDLVARSVSDLPIESEGKRSNAFCVFGTLRGIEETAAGIRAFVLSVLEPDIFVSAGFRKDAPQPNMHELLRPRVLEQLNPTRMEFENMMRRSPLFDELQSDAAKGCKRRQLGPAFGHPLSALFYNWYRYRCLTLIEDWEEQRGSRYEWIATSRADLIWLTKHPPLSLFDPDRVWVPEPAGMQQSRSVPTVALQGQYMLCGRKLANFALGMWPAIITGNSSWRDAFYRSQNEEEVLYFWLRGLNVKIGRFWMFIKMTCCEWWDNSGNCAQVAGKKPDGSWIMKGEGRDDRVVADFRNPAKLRAPEGKAVECAFNRDGFPLTVEAVASLGQVAGAFDFALQSPGLIFLKAVRSAALLRFLEIYKQVDRLITSRWAKGIEEWVNPGWHFYDGIDIPIYGCNLSHSGGGGGHVIINPVFSELTYVSSMQGGVLTKEQKVFRSMSLPRLAQKSHCLQLASVCKPNNPHPKAGFARTAQYASTAVELACQRCDMWWGRCLTYISNPLRRAKFRSGLKSQSLTLVSRTRGSSNYK